MVLRNTWSPPGRPVLLAAAFGILSVGFLAAEPVTLKSTDGRTLTAELLERGTDRVKIRAGRKVYVLPFDKLAAESVALVKKADVPLMCDFEIKVDLKKRSDTVERVRQERRFDAERPYVVTLTDSYRVDEVDGEVEVSNRDVADPSPAGTLHIAVLVNGAGGHKVMHLQKAELKELEALGRKEIAVGKSKAWHSPKGEFLPKGDLKVEGRYTGYVAAVVVEDRIVAVKASPANYEEDLAAVRRMLGLKRRPGLGGG